MPGIKSILKEIKKASKGHRIVSVGIEFGSSSIKIVELIEDRGVISLGNYGEISLGPFAGKPEGSVANLNTGSLSKALDQLLLNVPIDDPEAISVAIPLSATLVVPFEVKLSDDADLEKIVLAEVKKHIPVPLDQVYVDWQEVSQEKNQDQNKKQNSEDLQTTPEGDGKKSEEVEVVNAEKSAGQTKQILAFVINKDIIETYQNVLSDNNLSIEYFELEIYSVLRSAIPKNVQNALVVDIGAKYAKFYSIKNGVVEDAEKKLRGGINFIQTTERTLQIDNHKAETMKRNLDLSLIAENTLGDNLTSEIEKIINSIENFRKNSDLAESDPLYLAGGGSLLYGLPELLAKRLNMQVIICQPFINVSAPEYLNKLLVETGPEYAVAAGLALKHVMVV